MKHNIIVKFIEDYDYKNHLDEIKNLFNLALNVEGIIEIKYHVSSTTLPNRGDLWIEIICSEKGADNWKNCSSHITWINQYSKFVKTKMIFDCLE